MKLGAAKHEKHFSALVNTAQNDGNFFVLDVETDAYAIGDDLLALLRQAQKQHPDTKFYVTRIGCDAVFRVR